MSDEIEQLRKALERARVRAQHALAALAPKHKGGEIEEWRAAHAEEVAAERALGLSLCEETALACDWPEQWDAGAPNVHVLASSLDVLLLYAPRDIKGGVVVAQFDRCIAHRLGPPNDEVLSGHHLFGRGLEGFRAHLVANSRWIDELMRVNSVHPQFDASRWQSRRHYLLVFKEDVFECVADGHQVERAAIPMQEAIAKFASRLR